MSAITAYVIGLRVDPDRVDPEWRTLWFEQDGANRIPTKNGRMQWSSNVDAAVALARLIDGDVSFGGGKLGAVCDVASTLHDIANGTTGNEALVLDSLNLLDDMLITVNHPLRKGPKLRLDGVSGRLTEGVSLPEVVAAHDGPTEVVEAVLASLGRVLVWSDFTCDG